MGRWAVNGRAEHGRAHVRPAHSRAARAAHLTLLFALAACGSGPSEPIRPEPPPPPPIPDPIAIPARGTASTLDIATWNVLNFGATNQGPSDDRLQFARVRDVIRGTDADIWGMQEVISGEAFDNLVDSLPGYAGLLADDSTVVGGTDSYHSNEIKVGLIYKTSVLQPTAARIILADLDYEFAGRPPLEITARITFDGNTHDAVFIVLHAKAAADSTSWMRRGAGAAGLKAYLDENWPSTVVFVPGDWNDDVDESISQGRDTPYRVFVNATEDWAFPTAELSEAGITSILGFDEIIDHILASNEGMAWYEEDSALAYRVDEVIENYRQTVSNHVPVMVRFRPGGGLAVCAAENRSGYL